MHRRLRSPSYVCLFAFAAAAVNAGQTPWEKYMDQVRQLRKKGAYAEAVKPALAAVQEAEKSGREDTDLAKSWNNLATLYYDLGRYPEAEKLYQRSVDLWEKLLGPEDLVLSQGLNNLGVLYLKMGRFKGSESIERRVLAIREKILKPDDRDLAEILNNLAELNRAQGH